MPVSTGTFFDAGDELAQPLRQRHSAALDADQRQVFAAIALLDDLVGQAHQGSLNLGGGHQPALDAQGGLVWHFAHRFSLAACLSTDDTRLRGQWSKFWRNET